MLTTPYLASSDNMMSILAAGALSASINNAIFSLSLKT
jgi:hypothetical protein